MTTFEIVWSILVVCQSTWAKCFLLRETEFERYWKMPTKRTSDNKYTHFDSYWHMCDKIESHNQMTDFWWALSIELYIFAHFVCAFFLSLSLCFFIFSLLVLFCVSCFSLHPCRIYFPILMLKLAFLFRKHSFNMTMFFFTHSCHRDITFCRFISLFPSFPFALDIFFVTRYLRDIAKHQAKQ